MSAPSDDPLFDAIGGLPIVRPDAGYAEHLRERCQATLRRPARPLAVSLEPATIGTVCALYAWHVARIATQIPLP